MEKTLAWFDRYLSDHPEVELVYRRHPSEWKCKALDELAAKRPNFHVILRIPSNSGLWRRIPSPSG